MKNYSVFFKNLTPLSLSILLSACAVTTSGPSSLKKAEANSTASPQTLTFALSQAWGGAVQCLADHHCRLVAVEHEDSKLALIEFQKNKAVVLDKQPLAYHPDSAIWLTLDIAVAAVETGGTLDFFKVENQKLIKIDHRPVGFSPRDVIVAKQEGSNYTLLATPYSGKNVSWLTWDQQRPEQSTLTSTFWCEAPWHPVHIQYLPKTQTPGIAVACLDDKKIIAVPMADLQAKPQTLASFEVIPRQTRPSPSGRWLYIALETGGKNARLDMQSGELQYLEGDPRGSSSVLVLADDVVIWGDSQRLTFQKLDDQGQILDTQELKTSGYSTNLKLHDINRDGIPDILVLNSAGETADVIFGPLWKY